MKDNPQQPNNAADTIVGGGIKKLKTALEAVRRVGVKASAKSLR